MTAYVIGQFNVSDPSWIEKYVPKTEELIAKYGGKKISGSGPAESLEGNPQLPDALVIVEFPSVEKAKAWYNDPEYSPLITLRQSGSDGSLIVIDGA